MVFPYDNFLNFKEELRLHTPTFSGKDKSWLSYLVANIFICVLMDYQTQILKPKVESGICMDNKGDEV